MRRQSAPRYSLQHGPGYFFTIAAILPFLLVGIARGSTSRWGATGAAGVYMGVTMLVIWILQRFSVTEPDGLPSALESYMGMLGHAAVLRDDGLVFVHLHPAGSINLTAQMRFAEVEAAVPATEGGRGGSVPGGGHAGHAHAVPPAAGTVTFPFVFPEPGGYRIVVQVKVGAVVETAAFDVDIGEAPPS